MIPQVLADTRQIALNLDILSEKNNGESDEQTHRSVGPCQKMTDTDVLSCKKASKTSVIMRGCCKPAQHANLKTP